MPDFRNTMGWINVKTINKVEKGENMHFRIGLQNVYGEVYATNIHVYKKSATQP